MEKSQVCHDLAIMLVAKENITDSVQIIRRYEEYFSEMERAYNTVHSLAKGSVADIKKYGI